MTVVVRTVHKHVCATCRGEFVRRKYPSGELGEFCVCVEWTLPHEEERFELCDGCRKSIGEAGFIGDLVIRMFERLIACESTIAAFEKQLAAALPAPAAQEAPR